MTKYRLNSPGGVVRISLMLVMLIFLTILFFLLVQQYIVEERHILLKQIAQTQSQTLKGVRNYYAREIVSKVKKSENRIVFSHDYKDHANHLPIPASLTLDLAKYLSGESDKIKFSLISSYPFQGRDNRQITPISQLALQKISTSAQDSFFQFRIGADGREQAYYAEAVKMQASCVSCHNNHPQSPRKDWKVGDVRGIQEIILTEDLVSADDQKLHNLILWCSVFLFLATGGIIILLLHRNYLTMCRLEDLAEREKQKTQDLQRINAKAVELEGQLIDAIDALPDAFVLYDENDRLLLCNQKYREFYPLSGNIIQPGVKFEDIIRYGVARGEYPEAQQSPEIWIAERMYQHQYPNHLIEQQLQNGRWVRINEQKTEKGRTVGFRVDITELKQRESDLIRSEAQLRATIEAALDAIIIIDAEGIVQEFNPAACEIFQYQPSEVIGNSLAESIIPPDLRDKHVTGMQHYRATGEGPVLGKRITVPAIKKDGTQITIELAISPAQEGPDTVFVGYLRDITEELAKTEALTLAKEKAESATKAKAAFLAVMSHEIRTPLNGLLGLLALIEDNSKDKTITNYAHTASESARALSTLLNDILDYSKLEAGKTDIDRQIFEIEFFMMSISDLMRPLAEDKNLTFMISIDPEIPRKIYEDPARLRQVLLNLIGNAIKFTDQGHIKISVSCDGEMFAWTISDTGLGIKEEDLNKLFERFNTIDASYTRSQGGTGLGLAISKSISELLAGDLSVSSIYQKGSQFTLKLPRHPCDQNEQLVPAAARKLDKLPFYGNHRILLAEDNATNNLVMTAMLEAFGLEVVSVNNGQDAIREVEAQEYALLITDISMPIMDGVTATKHLRSLPEKQDLPIIAFTAFTQAEDRLRFEQAGFNEILFKPARRTALVDILDKYLGHLPKPSSRPQDIEQGTNEFIEYATLKALFAEIPDDIKLQLKECCFSDLQKNSALLMSAAQANDLDGVQRYSHVLKGVAGTYGLTALYEAAFQNNKLALAGEQEDAIQQAFQVDITVRKSMGELRKFFKTNNVEL